jgi:ComF family protein
MINLNGLKKIILDILFPIECLGCRTPDVWLCKSCLEKIPLNTMANCPVCHKANNASVCKSCRTVTALDGMLITTSYENPIIKQSIQALKYNYLTDLAKILSELMIKYIDSFDKKNIPAILYSQSELMLTCVPLHKKRLLERGFNQSELLARNFNQHFGFTYIPELLMRIKYTSAQALLSKKERVTNLNDAFEVNRDFNIFNKNVIIIDDVATTLTTLNECAKVLKRAGSKEVWGLVIARGS